VTVWLPFENDNEPLAGPLQRPNTRNEFAVTVAVFSGLSKSIWIVVVVGALAFNAGEVATTCS
jgi:hypothetical protein